MRVARKLARRSARIETVSFYGCSRRSRTKIVCRFLGESETPTSETTCGFRVVVRGEGSADSVQLRSPRCHTRETLFLSAARARQALQTHADEIAGKHAQLLDVARRSRLSFSALAEWTEPAPTGVKQNCRLELAVELLPSNSIQTKHSAPECLSPGVLSAGSKNISVPVGYAFLQAR